MRPQDRRTQPIPEAPRASAPSHCGLSDLPPAEATDPVTEALKKDVDRTLLIETLKLSPGERSRKFLKFMELAYELRRAGERSRKT